MSEEINDKGDKMSFPYLFKKYTIQDQKIFLQQPKRTKPGRVDKSYDGLADAKKIDLTKSREEGCTIYIATNLTIKEE